MNTQKNASRARGLRNGLIRAIAALALVMPPAGSAYAGVIITDINPDTSNNSNANASSGGRVNGLAANPEQSGLLRG